MFGLHLAILAALVALAPAARAEVYKWVDEKGVVNYSSTPPENRKSTKLDEEQGRVSTIPAFDSSKSGAPRREQALQERVARLEEEVARARQAAMVDEAAAAQAYRAWREHCIAQRRVDCDNPYAASYADWGGVFVPGVVARPVRRVAGTYIPTGKIAVGVGGVVGPYLRPPPGGFVAGAGPYGIGGGYQRAWPGGVVAGPGPYGIGAAFHPVEETIPIRIEPRPHPRPRR
jgi:hypothetical protein